MTELAGPGAGLVGLVLDVARACADQAERLNTLDGIAGDGDLGVTAGHALIALEGVAAEAAALEPGPALRKLGRAVASGAPSSGGTLIAFALMAAAAADDPSASDAARILAGMEAARASIAQRGDVTVGDRTMLDALSPATDAFAAATAGGASVAEAVAGAAAAADEGARATTSMEPKVGRAGWLKDRARGNEDPGARLVAIAFGAAARAIG